MPIHEFRCPDCGRIAEVIARVGAVIPLQYCCSEETPNGFSATVMEHIPSAPAIHFKGSGWTAKGSGRRV